MTENSAEEITIAFVDLSGFTALTEIHGDESGMAVAVRFHEMARSLMRGGAAVVKTIGDAVMFVAPDVPTAVEIVLDLQALTDDTPDFPVIRAGLHVGAAREAGHDYFGAAVNLAARVAAHASAGQILCTTAVINRIRERPACSSVPLGSVRFRNIHEPVAIYELRRAGSEGAAEAIDPICRMHVSQHTAKGQIKWEGIDYYFCSLPCLQMFISARLADEGEERSATGPPAGGASA